MNNHTLELEIQARRLVACHKALDHFLLVAIEDGQVQTLIDSALKLTEGAERLISWWTAHRDKPVPFQVLSGLSEPARRVLQARAELGDRYSGGNGPRAGARLTGDCQERRR